MNEKDRLDFILKRDGREKMLKFAEQTLAIYIMDSIEKGPHKASIEKFIEVLEENGSAVRIMMVNNE